jgi:hypothetical protein
MWNGTLIVKCLSYIPHLTYSEYLRYVHVGTTTNNAAKYTKREVEMARQVGELTQLLGYPSSKDLKTLIKSGSIMMIIN